MPEWAATLAAQRGWDPVLTCWAVAVAGEQLLGAGEVFAIGPLQLYAVTEQLQQGKPTCASGDAKTDLGHILDFTCRLKYLKVKLWEPGHGELLSHGHTARDLGGGVCVCVYIYAAGPGGKKVTFGDLGTVLPPLSTRGQSWSSGPLL